MKNRILRIITMFAAIAVGMQLAGCAATSMAISKRNLDVQTKMSSTVFLDPVTPEKRTLVLQVRNTSDKASFSIESELRAALAAKGYSLVSDPSQAHYMLQVNILQVGKIDPAAAENAFRAGYGGAILGAAVVAASGDRSNRSILTGGIIGGLASSVVDAMVKDVTYSVITDLQVSERLGAGKTARVVSEQRLVQGTSGTTTVSSNADSDWQRYQTRIMSSANKVNLDFEEAVPELAKGLSISISGLF